MKKRLSILLVIVLVLISFVGCSSKADENRPELLEELKAANIPTELLLENATGAQLVEDVIAYNVDASFDKVYPQFEKIIEELGAEEEFNADTDMMIAMNQYNQDYKDRGFSAWSYQGKVDEETSIYVSLVEVPKNLSSFTNVTVVYGDMGMNQEMVGEETSIDGTMIPDEEDSADDEEDSDDESLEEASDVENPEETTPETDGADAPVA